MKGGGESETKESYFGKPNLVFLTEPPTETEAAVTNVENGSTGVGSLPGRSFFEPDGIFEN